MTLDELVKDVDVQDVRNKDLTGERVASLYSDWETVKEKSRWLGKLFCYAGLALAAVVGLGFLLHILFPEVTWLWGSTR